MVNLVHVTTRVKFKFANYYVVVQCVSHFTTETLPLGRGKQRPKCAEWKRREKRRGGTKRWKWSLKNEISRSVVTRDVSRCIVKMCPFKMNQFWVRRIQVDPFKFFYFTDKSLAKYFYDSLLLNHLQSISMANQSRRFLMSHFLWISIAIKEKSFVGNYGKLFLRYSNNVRGWRIFKKN